MTKDALVKQALVDIRSACVAAELVNRNPMASIARIRGIAMQLEKDLEQFSTVVEKCEFDDACDFCNTPLGGSYAKMTYCPEENPEVEFYICGKCADKKDMIKV